MKTFVISGMLALLLSSGCGSDQASQELHNSFFSATPTEFGGISASLQCLGSRTLSFDKPVRFEYSFTNTTNAPVTLYMLGGATAFPVLYGNGRDWGINGSGLSGGPKTPEVTLQPGERISRWIELHKDEPLDDRWKHRIHVRSEEQDIHALFSSHEQQQSVLFGIGFEQRLLSGQPSKNEWVLYTGSIEIKLR